MLNSDSENFRLLKGPRSLARLGRSAGFSLVEVSIAIGIVAFAFVALFALLPQGASTFRRTIEVGVCSQIAQKIISDMQQMEFDELVAGGSDAAALLGSFRWPQGTGGLTRFYDESGNEVLVERAIGLDPKLLSPQQRAKISYWVNVRVVPQAMMPGPRGALRRCADLAQVTVQVAFNPSGQPLTYGNPTAGSPGASAAGSGGAGGGEGTQANLIQAKPGVSVLNYPVLISRGL